MFAIVFDCMVCDFGFIEKIEFCGRRQESRQGKDGDVDESGERDDGKRKRTGGRGQVKYTSCTVCTGEGEIY